MDFAKNILSKYGWKDGDGLGKEKQGIKKPIKANLKFDQAGLGAEHGGEFGNNWWERCFNDAAQNVNVQKEQNGKVTVDLKDAENSVEVSTKGYSVKKLKDSGSGVYGNNFLSADVAVSSFAVTKYKVLTDEELFQACGGRTAHKGARHGLKLSGKLARIAQQEQELLEKMKQNKADGKVVKSEKSIKIDYECNEEVPIKKNKRSEEAVEESFSRKKKSKNLDDENLEVKKSKTQIEELDETSNALLDKSSRDKKRKKKNKIKEENNILSPSEEMETGNKAQQNKKHSKLMEEESNFPEHNENNTQKKKKKRKSVPV